MVNASTVSSYFTFQMTKNSSIMSQIKWTCVSEWRPHSFPVWDLTQFNQSYMSCSIVVARAARLFFLIQPIISLFSGVVVARAALIFDKEEKKSSWLFASAFFIFVHFAAIFVLSKTWYDPLYSLVGYERFTTNFLLSSNLQTADTMQLKHLLEE